ncbi:MAG: conserved exported protein of unknown function [Nitrosopumilales archaeon]|nr:MAG: conserved exported protein of unknown function [Nitrosopumilales archaeon]
MNPFKAVLLSLSFLICSTSHSIENAPFNTVQNLFAAISEFDYAKMKAVVTDDFQLLEAGEVWDIDILIKVIKANENTYERRNYFSLIKEVSRKEIVWVSYWNKATFTNLDEIVEIAWLESVVLVDDKGTWKLQLMHSTGVSLENVPADVTFEEYSN